MAKKGKSSNRKGKICLFSFGFLFREIGFRQGGDDVKRLQADIDDG